MHGTCLNCSSSLEDLTTFSTNSYSMLMKILYWSTFAWHLRINDFHEETIRIAKTVFNDNSIHFLNNRKNILFTNYRKLINATKPDDNTVITGSSVLSLYGLRDCKDLDLIYYNDAPADSHNQYLETHYKLTLDDIVNNPLYHLYYNGFKYVSLDVIKNMKIRRNEPKDIIDVQLIESLKWKI